MNNQLQTPFLGGPASESGCCDSPRQTRGRPDGVCYSTAALTEYREIEGFPGYRVGKDGSVWSRWRIGRRATPDGEWKKLKPFPDRKGYLRVELYRGDGGKVRRLVHHLVLEAFVGPCPEGMEGCHDPDPNPANNCLGNLRWDTRKGNVGDAMRAGRMKWVEHRGSEQASAKLHERDIPAIFALRNRGLTQKEIGDLFGVSFQTISKVLRRNRWTHAEVSAT